ncbi:MAG: hypothetical protein NC127_08785 [Muribaculum sp.]|nr:hypothetical protein [Muribaculum sp.]
MRFAYEMCFGTGHHRSRRTGGNFSRNALEKFCNTFQGKLSELCLRRELLDAGLVCGTPDMGIYGKGKWDGADLMVEDRTVSVKSAAFFSNLLLLESEDYDCNGEYLPNLLSGSIAKYDYYVLVRIRPDIKTIVRKCSLAAGDNAFFTRAKKTSVEFRHRRMDKP